MSWADDDAVVPAQQVGPQLARVRAQVEELQAHLDGLPDQVHVLDAKLTSLGQGLRELEKRVLTQESDGRSGEASMRRLQARVEWLERALRMSALTEESDLEPGDPRERQLAMIAQVGDRARLRLLPAEDRDRLEDRLRRHAAAVAVRVSAERQLLASAEQLAETDPTHPGFAAAAQEFALADDELAQALRQETELAPAAVEAAQTLEQDEELAAGLGAEIDAGEQARAQLHDLLRSRVSAAVSTGHLLPSWFTAALGPLPPTQTQRAWTDAAVAVLAYRITFDVHDPVAALGVPPEVGHDPYRRRSYERIRRLITELDR